MKHRGSTAAKLNSFNRKLRCWVFPAAFFNAIRCSLGEQLRVGQIHEPGLCNGHFTPKSVRKLYSFVSKCKQTAQFVCL